MSGLNLVSTTKTAIKRAAHLLRDGNLVAFPTETVYGLGADATSDQAVARIFEAKGRPQFNPLIVHVADLDAAQRIGTFDKKSLALAHHFWPGPLTLVVPRTKNCPASLLASAGLDTIAIRVPGHPVAQALLQTLGRPVAAPSANPSGQVSPTRAIHVAQGLGHKVAMILDGGPCKQGLESTIVRATDEGTYILRPGTITREQIADIAGPLLNMESTPKRPQSPGQLLKHYAPKHPIRLNATSVEDSEALLAFGPPCPGKPKTILNLSADKNLTEAAANLFAHLRTLDETDCTTIAVMPIPSEGLGEAINDRLKRAAEK